MATDGSIRDARHAGTNALIRFNTKQNINATRKTSHLKSIPIVGVKASFNIELLSTLKKRSLMKNMNRKLNSNPRMPPTAVIMKFSPSNWLTIE